MLPLHSLPRTEPRTPQRSGERSTDRHHARLFQDLLDALPDPPAASATLPTPSPYSGQPGADVDEPPKTASARPIASPDNNVGAHHALPAIDGQTLTLRASTGPLAGLLVQAEWRNQRLSLRLSAPDGTLAARLEREQQQLSVALSVALGGEVVMEVRHAR